MKKIGLIFSFVTLVLGISLAQQVEQVTVGVNGLHCSACSFTVEKALMKVDFVSVVMMDLNERKARVILDHNKEVDFHKLAKAVTDAGYSVRDVIVTLNNEIEESRSCLEVSDNHFCLLDTDKESNEFRLMGKAFLPKKEFKKLQLEMPETCVSCGTDKNRYLAQWF